MTVEALRRHRPETLADLLSAYGRELQAVAYLILRDRGEAEDVVIETLLTAFEHGGSIRDAQEPRPERRHQQGARDAAQDCPSHPPRHVARGRRPGRHGLRIGPQPDYDPD